jgi:hypothetical protein
MAEVSEAEARARRIPAYALLRAAVAQDADAAVLLVDQAAKPGLWTSWCSTWPTWPPAPCSGPRGTTSPRFCGSWIPGWTRQYTASSAHPDGQHDPRPAGPEEAKAARTVAAYAMVRAMLARDTWTMSRILDQWATGPGAEAIDFAAAMTGVGASFAIGMAAGNRDRALAEADDALAAARSSFR